MSTDLELEVGHLHLAAFILTRAGGEVRARLGKDDWVHFVFVDTPAVEEALGAWRAGSTLVDAKQFVAAQRYLQRLINEARCGQDYRTEAA